jgi:hypothetical protein
MAATTIKEELEGLLKVAASKTRVIAETDGVPAAVREQADDAAQAAMEAARVLSTYKRSLESGATVTAGVSLRGLQPPAESDAIADRRWIYDSATRTIRTTAGAVVATLSPKLRGGSAEHAVRLIAAAPAVWSALDDAQHMALSVLAHGTLSERDHEEFQRVLERINDLTDFVETD